MKANELRIGNLVMDSPISIPKLQISSDGVIKITGHGIDCFERGLIEYEPIPLTEEWLVEFGFEKIKNVNEDSRYCDYQHQRNWGIKLIGNIHGGYVFVRETGFTHIQYVHQLQNLYYVLTGEELTIKE